MESDSNNKEFLENLKLIHLLTGHIYSADDKGMYLSFFVGEDAKVFIKVLEKDRIWLKQFDYDSLNEYKMKTGIQGNWKSFFQSMNDGINPDNGGQITVKYPKNQKEPLVLYISHPLKETLKVQSELQFTKYFTANSEEFKKLNFDFVSEMYQSRIQGLKDKRDRDLLENSKNYPISSNNSKNMMISSSGQKLEIKKNLKRKYNSDLINPNAKKRKNKGVKFTMESKNIDEEEDGSEV
jgi:hypothetical protein